MLFTYFSFSRTNTEKWLKTFDSKFYNFRKKIKYLLIITGGFFIARVIHEINVSGGYDDWIFNKFVYRYKPTEFQYGFIELTLYLIHWRYLFDTLVCICFLHRQQLKNNKLYGILLPLISIIFALTTGHRGSILLFLISLFFTENVKYTYIKKIIIYLHMDTERKKSITLNIMHFFQL